MASCKGNSYVFHSKCLMRSFAKFAMFCSHVDGFCPPRFLHDPLCLTPTGEIDSENKNGSFRTN